METSQRNVMTRLAVETKLLKEVGEKDRNKLQEVLTEMLQDIQIACDKEQLQVALGYGSVIGAVRHGGFIPWDDDIDLIMLREDWERFKLVFDDVLGDKYILEAPNYGNKDTKCTWGKIYKRNTELVEIMEKDMPFEKGIFIDVFVYDNVPNNKMVRKLDGFLSFWMKGIATSQLLYKYENKDMRAFMNATPDSAKYYKRRILLGKLLSFVSHKKWCDFLDSYMARHKKSEYITVPMGTSYEYELFKATDIVPFVKGQFNGLSVNLPHNTDLYLRRLYGDDYMQIPPIEKREKHFIVSLKF